MEPGLRISVVDRGDADYIGIEINAASERYAGATRIYAGFDELSEFASQVEGFPESVFDERKHEFGSTEPWVAGGFGSMRFCCSNKLGHAVLEVSLEDDHEWHATASAKFSFRIHAADVDRFARLPWPALVCGETGVGKELVARALHERSPRRAGPFVALNGGGLPRDLIESELFGHERGAFTGAIQSHRGAFEQAHGGTLFLDEVAELPSDLQTRLLRVLETWHVRRVGSELARHVDVRLVCATHRDLRRMVQEGSFRADLYYRIHRLVIDVPPLRHRTDDIGALAEHILSSMAAEVGPKRLSSEAIWRLRAYSWPGNVRELRNALELAAVNSDSSVVEADSIGCVLRQLADPAARPSIDTLRRAIERHGGNLSAAARALGIPRSTLRDRLRDASSPDGAPQPPL